MGYAKPCLQERYGFITFLELDIDSGEQNLIAEISCKLHFQEYIDMNGDYMNCNDDIQSMYWKY